MKKIVNIVLGCLLTVTSVCSCSRDTFSTEEEQATSTPGNGVELPYQIAPFQTDGLTSRAVAPTTDETRINNITYLLFQFTGNTGASSDESMWECTGSYYQTNVGQSGETGKLSFQLPSSLDENATYQVLAICNLASYCPTSLESFGLRLRGENLSNVKKNLTSTGLGKFTGDAEQLKNLRNYASGDNMLMTGEFTFTPKQNVPLLTLNRKNVIYETNIKDLPADVTIKYLTIHNFPLQTYLFSENKGQGYATTDFTIPAEYIQQLGTTFKFYYLPTSTDNRDMVSIDLAYTLSQDNYVLASGSGQAPTFKLEKIQSEEKKQIFKMRIGPETDNAGYYFAPNDYIRAVLFEAADKPNNMLMTLNGWLTGEYTGVYQLASDGTRGYSVSSDHLNFPFCRQEPMPSSRTSILPDGSQSYEIFIAGHGVLPSWSIDYGNTAKPSWITIENHNSRSSIIVTVEPNFKLAADGSIISTPRLFKFNLKIGEATFPITVRQDAAPLYAGDVTLPNGLTVSGKNYGATSANYYTNNGYYSSPKYSGDHNARGTFFNHTDHAWNTGTGNPDSGQGFSSSYTASSVSDLQNKVCGSGGSFRLPTGKELALYIFPYIKYLRSSIDGRTADIYYLSSENAICFIPYTGSYAGVSYAGSFYYYETYPYTKQTGWYGKDDVSGNDEGYQMPFSSNSFKALAYTGILLGGNTQATAEMFGGPRIDNSTEQKQYTTYMFRCVKGSVKTETGN